MRALLLAAVLLIITPAAAGAANLYVAPGGGSTTCASQLNPCGSLNAAYQAAQPGDTVEVAGGSYGSQTLLNQASKTSAADVTFTPAAGAVPSIGSLNFGANYDQIGASHVTIQGLDVRSGAEFHRTQDVTLRNVRIHGAVFGSGAKDLAFYGGEWGDPAVTLTTNKDGWHPQFTAYDRPGNVVRPDGLTIDGVYIHDIGRPLGRIDVHTNCLHPQDGNNIRIVNNTFRRCDVFDMLVSPSGVTGAMTNIMIAHNDFGRSTNTAGTDSPKPADYSVMLDPQSAPITGVHLWKNTFGLPFVIRAKGAGVTGDKYGNTGAVNDSVAPLTALSSDPEGPGPEPTPTPTATPTATPSPTPTGTPSPTPSPTATPSPSPTATPTATPSSTPSATPTPEPVYAPDCEPTCDQQISDLKATLEHARALATELADALR